MTAKDYKKAFTQLNSKPVKAAKYMKHNAPKKRTTGKAKMVCRNCGRRGTIVNQYKIGLCRQCFRDKAKELGFKKYS
ncbi:MAG: 30S ribosomal protein S14 [Candidatus Woesearchaeota archaeon]